MNDTVTVTVAGMSCGHCAAAVKREVGKLPGVSTVDVDLATKRVTVTGLALDRGAVVEAVDEAGYRAE